MFCFDNPLVFCENIRGRKKTVFLYAHNHVCKYHVYRASEIYVWRGQTPFVMSIAATRQRSSHRRPRHCAP
ncbi:hypothetical protein D8Y76_02420 [Shigella flexneri]|nr:hypothetical protein [Shigella flexneri]EFX8707992.1 hypothetical protein [Shigella flexneri]